VVSTRRGLLGALGAGALFGGCGDDPAPTQRADESRGGESSLADVALLNDALAAERRTRGVLPRAEEHARILERAIARAGGEARPDAGGATASDAEAAAGELVAFYVDVLAKLAEARLREEVAGLLSDAAAALAAARLRAAPGRSPLAAAVSAFEAGRSPS
jgi:hypothetical protein